MSELERAYRVAERRREVPLEAKVFRGKVGVLLALQLSLLLAASALAVDLRRLRTPEGAARAYAEAVAFGDCARVRDLSTGPPLDCAALEARARERAEVVGDGPLTVRVELLERSGDRASVAVEVTDPGGSEVGGLGLVQRDGEWLVERDQP